MDTYCFISDFDSPELGEMELLYSLAKGRGFFCCVCCKHGFFKNKCLSGIPDVCM